MVGCYLSEDVGVVNKAAEIINALRNHLARRNLADGGVIRGIEADQHIITLYRLQLVHDP